MKEILLKLWPFLTSVYLQMILGFIAFLTWDEVGSGYLGRALPMGLITCACIICIVWLEITKSKKSK